MNDQATKELVKYVKALLLLQLHTIEKSTRAAKPELLLARVGLTPREIADLLGKNTGAVAKTLQRAGRSGT
jgi:DNA-directed RNA polymerase specialized sigma24 family protein